MTATAVSAPPRFRHVPLFASSAGQDCIDLAAHAGLILDPWQCDVVIDALGERENGKWSATQVDLVVPRQNGKGGILEAVELFFLFLDPRVRLVTHTAHRFDTCLDHFRRVRTLIERTPDLLEQVSDTGRRRSDGLPSGIKDSNGKEAIHLKNRDLISFKAREKGSGRGFPGDVVVFDEAFWLGDLTGLVSSMSAASDPQVWFTSSAPLPRSESDSLRKIMRRGRALATDGGPDKVAYTEYSCPDDADLDDPGSLQIANPGAACGRLNEDLLEEERALYDRDELARERYGIVPLPDDAETKWELFDENDWTACHVEWDPDQQWMADPVTYALELTLDGGTAAIVAAGSHPDGRVAVEVIEHRPTIETRNGEPTEWVVDRIEALHKHNPKALLIDPGSPAGQYIRPLTDKGVEVTEVSTKDLARASQSFLVGVRAHTIAHHGPGNPDLNAAAAAAKQRKIGEVWYFDRRGTTPVAALSAAALARWGHLEIAEPELVPGYYGAED